MSLRFALLLLLAGLCSGCVLSGDYNPMKTSKGRDEAREAYVQLGIGYLQQGMTERAKVPLKKALSWTAAMPMPTRRWPWCSRRRWSRNWPMNIFARRCRPGRKMPDS